MSSDTSSSRRLLGILACLSALATLATNILLPVFPEIAASMSVSTQGLGVTLSAFFIPFALGQLLVGPLSDRLGRKWLMLGGLAVLALGSVICAAATHLETMVLGRVIQGLGASAPSVLARSIARDRFDGAALARALSFMMIAMAAAPGFSPLLGGLLGKLAGWRLTFWLVAGVTVWLGLTFLARVGETHPPRGRRHVTIWATLRDYGQLLGDRRFIGPALAVGMTTGGLMTFFAATPAILIDGLGFSPMALGYFFASTVFVVFGAGMMAPRLARRWGGWPVAATGALLALAGGAGLLVGEIRLLDFSVAISVFLLGAGLLNPLGTALALQPFAAKAGAASALLGCLQMGVAAAAIMALTGFDWPASRLLGAVLVAGLGIALAGLMLLRTASGTGTAAGLRAR